MNKLKNVIMIGPCAESQGGISSLIQNYISSGIMKKLHIDYYPIHFVNSYSYNNLFYLLAIIKISLNIIRYDILHVHASSWWSYRKIFPLLILGKLLGKKIIIHLHGGMFDIYYKEAYNFEKNLIRYGFSLANRVIVLSHEWIERIKAFCETAKIRVISNCVIIKNNNKYLQNIKRLVKPRTILFMGDIVARKGVYDLVEAIKLLQPIESEISVILCGQGEVDRVRNIIKLEGLDTIVSVPGWVSGSNKENLFNIAYLFILPSYFEGLPMSILEAMATGTPVISTSVGGIPDAVGNGIEGILIKPGDILGLAAAIKKMLNNEGLWATMSQAAKHKISKKFSDKRITYQLRNLYAEL
ncbi:glycosyltransferase family 4 protein [Desulfobacca acetoxidans]|uniref:Glycosyl transferase group 1 n=1 Tax=Desulfobacca acetoxidans (strain ATCC 700848 / DSM 11109 / ASRB2) TaxID=880072 RepID=F2NDG6_DESAR|nr:glycosyltransferase family 4 protein [Desulfobacca acetoxidans]AEB10032.1 glycosyl transferase group 1 [Desulfobacca acetoxidans DSM 11109]